MTTVTARAANKLTQALIDQQSEGRRLAYRRYARLLDADNPTPQNVQELQHLMQHLGLSEEQLKQDSEAMRELRRLQQVVKDGQGLDEQRTTAQKAVGDFFDESHRIIQQREAQAQELRAAADALEQRWIGAQQAEHRIKTLRMQNPVLESLA